MICGVIDRRVRVAIGRRRVGHQDRAVVVAARWPARAWPPRLPWRGTACSAALKSAAVAGAARRAPPRPRPGVHRLALQVGQLLVGEPPAERREERADVDGRRRAARPCPPSLPVHAAMSCVGADGGATTSAVTGPSVPGVHARGAAISGNGCGATHVGRELLVRPAAAEAAPRSPGGRWRRPSRAGALRPTSAAARIAGRVGQPRAVDLGQIPRGVHHLRPLQPFVLDRAGWRRGPRCRGVAPGRPGAERVRRRARLRR